MTTAYTTGQITLTNGSAVVTGVGTGWAISLIAGGIVAPQASGNLLPIATVDSDTQITAEIEWVGLSGTYEYAIIRDTAYLQQLTANSNTLAQLIAELAAGTVFKFDASGDLAGRASFNDRAKGFSYLVVIGVPQPQLYVKASATSGDWAGPFSYGTGPKGDKGDVGDTGLVNWRGPYSGATAYAKNDGVYNEGSAWIALQAGTGHAPPSLPTTSNAYWSLMAVKGTDGTGTGDVVGPNGGVTDGYLVAFNGGTGKLIKQLTPAMVKTLLAYTALDVSFDNSVANLAGAPATVQAAINAVASSGGKNDALFAIEIADLKGQRMGMVGGVADSFDDTTGVAMQNGTDRDTLCLLHFDGANGSTTITDNGSAGATWTPTGAVAVSTNQSKFGGASGIFNAGTNDFVTASPFSESQLKRGDFTIDVWVRPTISTSQIICDFRTTLTNAANLVLYIDATSTPKFAFLAAGTQRIIGTTTAAVNTWYHLALVRYAGVTKMYVNGVQEGVSYTDATYYVAPETGIRLGADYTNSTSKFGGYMDEFRLSKVARWTSNFTPPAAAYSFDANASLNYTYDAAGDLFTPTRILVIDSDGVPQTATSAGSTFTLIDRTNPIANGAVVSALRFFATNAGQYTIKIVRRVSGTVYDVLLSQVVNHPGGGLVEFALTTPFTVPSSGVIYAGVNYGTAVIPNLSNVTIRTYIGSNPAVGNGVTGWTEDSNNFIPMNVVYQPENMTLVSVAYTASSTPNNARIAVQLADSLTLTPNTDFTAEVSRDGGTTWTAVTLSLTMPSFGGVKMYEGSVSVLGQPSGTSMKWRFKTITNKAIFASGVVLQYS